MTANDLREAVSGLINDYVARLALGRRGAELVDGYGAERIVRVLQGHGQAPDPGLRRASAEDVAYVWRVNSEASVRRSAIDTNDIPFESHVEWFRQKLASPDCLLLIALDRGNPVGVIRLDRHGSDAYLSIALEPEVRGRGIGRMLIALASGQAFRDWPVSRITADVRPENVASRTAFERAGFTQRGSRSVGEVIVDVFVHDR